MKIILLIISFLFIFINEEIPSSKRSKEVISLIKPRLESELADKGLKMGSAIYMRVFKESNEFEIWVENSDQFIFYKNYSICKYSGDLGPKIKEGDMQSPEGFYKILPHYLNPNSDFHLSFNIGFPNKYDKEYNRTGSFLMVHGNCVSIGCYAMTDSVMEEIYTLTDQAFRGGQPHINIHIFPFRMTDENMEKYKGSKWYYFWTNLKEGFDIFNNTNKVPEYYVSDKTYKFIGN